jgi:hypothetical protein
MAHFNPGVPPIVLQHSLNFKNASQMASQAHKASIQANLVANQAAQQAAYSFSWLNGLNNYLQKTVSFFQTPQAGHHILPGVHYSVPHNYALPPGVPGGNAHWPSATTSHASHNAHADEEWLPPYSGPTDNVQSPHYDDAQEAPWHGAAQARVDIKPNLSDYKIDLQQHWYSASKKIGRHEFFRHLNAICEQAELALIKRSGKTEKELRILRGGLKAQKAKLAQDRLKIEAEIVTKIPKGKASKDYQELVRYNNDVEAYLNHVISKIEESEWAARDNYFGFSKALPSTVLAGVTGLTVYGVTRALLGNTLGNFVGKASVVGTAGVTVLAMLPRELQPEILRPFFDKDYFSPKAYAWVNKLKHAVGFSEKVEDETLESRKVLLQGVESNVINASSPLYNKAQAPLTVLKSILLKPSITRIELHDAIFDLKKQIDDVINEDKDLTDDAKKALRSPIPGERRKLIEHELAANKILQIDLKHRNMGGQKRAQLKAYKAHVLPLMEQLEQIEQST